LQRAEADHTALHAASLRLQQASAARPGLVAQQELDDAIAKDRAAEAQTQVARAALAAAKQQVEVSKADLNHYSSLADYSHITAPFSGIVTWRYADTGALIQAGTSNAGSMPVVKVAEIDKLRLRLPVPELLAANVHPGDSADVLVQATGEHFTGKIQRETGSLDPATRTEQVEVDVENQDHKLTPGMYAQVRLNVQSSPNALSVPVQAVSREAGSASVYLVDSNNRVQKKGVQTGIETADRVEVRSGLNAGDRVIVGNLSIYQNGQVVTPEAAKISNAGEEQ
jgi:RND family efflux transporter MFP subunit